MRTSPSDTGRLRELAHREHGAVDITLYWDRDTSTVTVVVWNRESGACLMVNPTPERANEAFVHPYAYAAGSGVPRSDILRTA